MFLNLVRLCPDKLEIIDMCLQEKKNGYKKKDKVRNDLKSQQVLSWVDPKIRTLSVEHSVI